MFQRIAMLIAPRLTAFVFACAAACGATVSSAQHQAGVENEVAVQGYNNEPINTYSETADFRLLGRGVGLLNVMTDVGPFPCTAFMVDDTHLLTNHHCVPGVLKDPRTNATVITGVTFLAGYLQPGLIEESEQFEVDIEPVETSEDLDYSVLRVRGVPVGRYPPLPLTAATAAEGMPYWIIGHPKGLSQHISREGCRAGRPPQEDDRLRHTCDTLGGNSGSPIIDSSGRRVIGLHNSGNSRVGINFGIPMAMILQNSSVLKETIRDDATPQPLPLVMSVFPKILGVGQELSVVADLPKECTPAFVDMSASLKLTPIPLEIFEKVQLSDHQTRYQVTATSTYGLLVQEEDEKGEHKLGMLCGSAGLDDQKQLKDALRAVVGALRQGKLDGKVTVNGGTVAYAFASYTIE
jgi:V8-like Glu-specific endopeptidase